MTLEIPQCRANSFSVFGDGGEREKAKRERKTKPEEEKRKDKGKKRRRKKQAPPLPPRLLAQGRARWALRSHGSDIVAAVQLIVYIYFRV